MTYEEAMEKVRVLNEQGWALMINQNAGKKVEAEFSAAFYSSRASTPGEFYGKTIPEAIARAAQAVEEQMAVWAHQSGKR